MGPAPFLVLSQLLGADPTALAACEAWLERSRVGQLFSSHLDPGVNACVAFSKPGVASFEEALGCHPPGEGAPKNHYYPLYTGDGEHTAAVPCRGGETPYLGAFGGSFISFCDHFPEVVLVGGGCSGTLVAPGVVLTARHCLADADTVRAAFMVRLDDPKVLDIRYAQYEVLRAVPHPQRDLALLFLDAVPPFQPAMWRTTPSEEAPDQVLAIGFGGKDFRTGLRRQGSKTGKPMTPGGSWGCLPGVATEAGCRPGWHMVVWPDDGGADTCPGDSGGPLYEPVGDWGWRLVAVTSRGVQGGYDACGDGGVYERVDTAAAWMVEKISTFAVIDRAMDREVR